MLILLFVWTGRMTVILFQIRHLTFQKLQSDRYIQDGYKESKEQMKVVIARVIRELSGT